jgi:hypothetical protein
VDPDDISTVVFALVYDRNQDSDNTTVPSTTRFERAAEIKKECPVRYERTNVAHRDLSRLLWKFEES